MMFEITKGETGPLHIDERFIQGLEAIAGISHEIVRRSYADSLEMTVDQITNMSDADISAIEDFETQYELRQAQKYLRPSYSVSFANGLKVTTNHSQEIVHALNNEPEEASALSLRMRVHERFNLAITVEPRALWSASYNVEAGQTDVHNVEAHIKKLMKNAEPDHPFLHGWIFRLTVAIALCVVSGAISIAAFAHFLPNAVRDHESYSLIVVSLFGALTASGAMMATQKLKRAYPKVEFAFGRPYRRRGARRAFIAWAFSVIIAPTAFLILGAMIAPAAETNRSAAR